MPAPRTISLLPAATEIVCALGLQECLVGRSHECDYPPEIRHLPVCTASRIDTHASSAALDVQVKTLLASGQSPFSLQFELMRDLRPELILTQGQCEACAVDISAVEKWLAGWSGPGPAPGLLALTPVRFAQLWDDLRRVAVALGAASAGQRLLKELRQRTGEVAAGAVLTKRRPTVACLEWFEPLMAAGNWVPELVELAGGLDLFGEPGKHSPWLNWEALVEHDPEVILCLPCGFDLTRIRRELPALTSRPGWTQLRAVRSGRLFLADGSQFFNRPGPRLVDSLEILAEILHPDRFHFGHETRAWVRA